MKHYVTIEGDMPDDSTVEDAESWAGALLETAFRKPNPQPARGDGWKTLNWTATVPMTPNEHPFRPRVVRATSVT
jgi:hypothetical protein